MTNARQLGDPAEQHGKNQHRQNGTNDGPRNTDRRLFVTYRKVAPCEDRKQLAVGP